MHYYNSPLSAITVKEIFTLHNGILYWKVKTCKQVVIGEIAGYIDSYGYTVIGIYGEYYKRHQLIFLWHHGYIPKEIDHIDRNRANDKIENLREASQQQNCWNKSARKNKSSKYIGVSKAAYIPKNGAIRWLAQIQTNNKTLNLGTYDTEEEAAIIYNLKAKEFFGEYANLNEL